MLTNEQKIIYIAITSAVLLLCIMGYFIYTFVKQHKKIVAWQQARIKAEVEILEGERKRIATDLHDEIGPLLSVIKMQVNQLHPTTEVEEIILQKSSNQIDEVVQKFRNISYNLLPNTLVRKGVVYATQEFIDKIEHNNLSIKFSADALELTTETAVSIFRIIQEITHNTIKHARATQLTIAIANYPKTIDITTKDDGIGFVYNEQTQRNKGLGLLSLENRIEILHGNLKIETDIGKGVQYFISIPKTKI